VLWRHVVKNAAIPVVTVMGLRLGFLMGGAVITETIFAWPGIGRYAWEGARNVDLNVVMGVTLAGVGIEAVRRGPEALTPRLSAGVDV